MKKIILSLVITLAGVNVFGQKIHKIEVKCDREGDIYLSAKIENTYIEPIVCIIFKVRYDNYQFSYIDKLIKVKVNIQGWSEKAVNFYPPVQDPLPKRVLLSRVVYENGEFTNFNK